jgi:hypothetical protein
MSYMMTTPHRPASPAARAQHPLSSLTHSFHVDAPHTDPTDNETGKQLPDKARQATTQPLPRLFATLKRTPQRPRTCRPSPLRLPDAMDPCTSAAVEEAARDEELRGECAEAFEHYKKGNLTRATDSSSRGTPHTRCCTTRSCGCRTCC